MTEYITSAFGKHHDPLFRAIRRGETGKRVNVLAPRGFCEKYVYGGDLSTCTVCFSNGLTRSSSMKPYNFIIIVSKSFTMATDLGLRDIKRKIEADIPIPCNSRENQTWGEQHVAYG